MYVQTFHQRPNVEGMTAWTPDIAYDFWDTSFLLKAYRTRELVPDNQDLLSELHANWQLKLLSFGKWISIYCKDVGI